MSEGVGGLHRETPSDTEAWVSQRGHIVTLRALVFVVSAHPYSPQWIPEQIP